MIKMISLMTSFRLKRDSNTGLRVDLQAEANGYRRIWRRTNLRARLNLVFQARRRKKKKMTMKEIEMIRMLTRRSRRTNQEIISASRPKKMSRRLKFKARARDQLHPEVSLIKSRTGTTRSKSEIEWSPSPRERKSQKELMIQRRNLMKLMIAKIEASLRSKRT